MAGEPRYAALLLGLGLRELSMSPGSLPRVKHRIRNLDMIAATRRAEAIMDQSDSGRIAAMLDDFDSTFEHDDQVVRPVTVREQDLSVNHPVLHPVAAQGAQLGLAEEGANVGILGAGVDLGTARGGHDAAISASPETTQTSFPRPPGAGLVWAVTLRS